MRIIINGRFLTRPTTGVERFAQEVMQRLAARVPEVEIVLPAQGSLHAPVPPQTKLTRVGSSGGHLWEQTTLPAYAARGPAAVLVNLANTAPALRRRQIVVVHDVTFLRYPHSYSWRFRTWYRALVALIMRRSAGVATVSEFSRGELTEVYGRHDIVVTPNAAGDWPRGPRTRPTGVPDCDFFLVVGSPTVHKNTVLAAEAYGEYRGRGGRADLVIVGAAAGGFSSIGEIDGVGIHRLGRVTDAELAWLYAHCTGFVFPSLYEGFGLPPLEAQAAGATVLAADIPSLREVLIAGSALWFDPASPGALATAMLSLPLAPEAAQHLAIERDRNLERFDWDHAADAIIALADRVAGNARRDAAAKE